MNSTVLLLVYLKTAEQDTSILLVQCLMRVYPSENDDISPTCDGELTTVLCDHCHQCFIFIIMHTTVCYQM